MIDLTGLDAFVDKIDNWLNRKERLFEVKYAQIIRATFEAALEGSPQWSGNFVANWNVNVGTAAGNAGRYSAWGTKLDRDQAYFRGHPDAINEAKKRNPIPERVPLNSGATLYNNTPYGDVIYENRNLGQRRFLRPGNYIDPNNVPIDYVKVRFKSIVKEVAR